MTTRLTLFTATLVQDSAISVSGLDREASADRPFALVDGVPTLVGRGLKGAAVAMAKRFFDPLPRAISDDVQHGTLRRSAWEFANADQLKPVVSPRIRAGVGIRQMTGARAQGILYDLEVIPADTRWKLRMRVDRSHSVDDAEFTEAEGILGYILAMHWAQGRCWLGGGAARGLGWCHIEDLKAYRLNPSNYRVWVDSDREALPAALATPPIVQPTRSWYFRTLNASIAFGEYKPEPTETAWGVDMFAVGPHDTERALQRTGDGTWTRPAWAKNAVLPNALSTDRALLMDGNRPLLPGSSIRGPIRHAFSRGERAAGRDVQDPHLVQGNVDRTDRAGRAFGTVRNSSRILIRDARAESNWTAAKLHMHAEDEFSAGSYGSAKRDAVRMLSGKFLVQIVVEGETIEEVDSLVKVIDRQITLGRLGHLFIGGHKTRGAGAGHWQVESWRHQNVTKMRDWTAPQEPDPREVAVQARRSFIDRPADRDAWVKSTTGAVTEPLTLGVASKLANAAFDGRLVAWWCEPTINLSLREPPKTFDRQWPAEDDSLQVDEVAFYNERGVWRAARTMNGARFVFIEEAKSESDGFMTARVVYTPVRLHGFQRFASARTEQADLLQLEWRIGDHTLGFTLTPERR